MNVSMVAGSVIINGKQFTGKNISVADGKIYVDGDAVGDSPDVVFNIEIHGEVETLLVDRGVIIANGRVGVARTVSGDIECNDVSGDVRTVSGAVKCGRVEGGVSTVSGDIKRSVNIK